MAESKEEEDNMGDRESIDQLLESYNDIQEEMVETKTPFDIDDLDDRLPTGASFDGEKLWVTDNTSNDAQNSSLTDRRKNVLREYAKTRDVTQTAATIESSESHIYATKDLFGFLLEDPVLFEAFLLDRQQRDVWEVKYEDGSSTTHCKAAACKFARKKFAETGEIPLVVGPDGDFYDAFPDDIKGADGNYQEQTQQAQASDTSSDVEVDPTTAERHEWEQEVGLENLLDDDNDHSHLQDIAESKVRDDDGQQSPEQASEQMETSQTFDDQEKDKSVSISPDETKRVMAALNRDGQDQLAAEIFDRMVN